MTDGDKNDGNESGRSLVVIGASAGGVEALSTFVGSLREGFSAPIVIAQHLDPRRPSLLAELLERRSTLPIVLVEEECGLEAGKTYRVKDYVHDHDLGTVRGPTARLNARFSHSLLVEAQPE